jgi:hypothetical protein
MFRFRYSFVIIGVVIALSSMFGRDPFEGQLTFDWLTRTTRFFIGLGLVFWGFRMLSDYKDADGETLHSIAKQSPHGAGLALVYRGLAFIALAIVFHSVAGAQTVPANAHQHLPTLRQALNGYWPTMPRREVLAGQIEKESCITLQHSRCWSTTSRLKSAREEGAGLPQITRTYRADGSIRFDALAEMKAAHPVELRNLTWENVYRSPREQIAVIVLKNRDNWATFRNMGDPESRLYATIKSYNRGVGGVTAEIKRCAATAGCDPRRFVGHVGKICTASRQPLYGNRSACDISLAYPFDVVDKRSVKYRPYMV